MTSPYTSRCGSCGEPTVKRVHLERYETTRSHDGREYPLSVPELDAYQCDSCMEVTLDDDGEERVTVALYDAAKLLRPAQIRSERERLGYMAKELAELLGVSPSTLSRWENGNQIQQRQTDRSMRQLFAVPAARDYAVMLRDGEAAAFEVPCRVHDWPSGTSSSVHAWEIPNKTKFRSTSASSLPGGSDETLNKPGLWMAA